jgi:flagellar biosynthetic protein FliR
MTLTLSLPTLFAALLVLARVSGALAFVPLPGLRHTPAPVRAALSVSIALALAPLIPSLAARLEAPALLGTFAVWLAAEAAFGVAAGLIVALLAEIPLISAQILGVQAGYSYASTIDPASEADSGILLVAAQLFSWLLMLAFGLDRHVIRTFAASLETLPPGALAITPEMTDLVLRLLGGIFRTGVRLALPVVAALVLADIAFALMSRVHSQLQLLSMAFPLKMLAALAMLAWLAPAFRTLLEGSAFETAGALARLAKP